MLFSGFFCRFVRAVLLLLVSLLCLSFCIKPVSAAFSANAGSNQTVFVNTKVNLTGSASGMSGGISSWFWQQIQGPKVSLSFNVANPSASFVPNQAGSYVFLLTATDTAKNNAYAVVFVTVAAANMPLQVALISPVLNQTINNNSSITLSWQVKNVSGISLSNVLVSPAGSINGSVNNLNYSAITPSAIASWPNGAVQTFSVVVTAAANQLAGVYTQNWSLKHDFNQTLPFTNSPNALSSSLTVPQNAKLSLLQENLGNSAYQAGTSLSQGTSNTVSWTVRNDSNFNLSNVSLISSTANNSLTVGQISPAVVNSWPQGSTQTFQAVVSVPLNDTGGAHSQSWNMLFNGNPLLSLAYQLNTPLANISLSLNKAYFTDDNSALVDGAVILQGTSRTINWQVQNNSNINLTNISLNPGLASGDLQIGAINPSNIANWGVGETKSFAVTVTAPNTSWSGRHSQSWRFAAGGQILNLKNQLKLTFSLSTDPLQCAINIKRANSNPPLVQAPLSKVNSVGAFTDNGTSQKSPIWSCVLDANSGLLWEVKTQDGGLRDFKHSYTYAQVQSFVAAVNAQGLCGYKDWRLPAAEELLSLVSSKESDNVYTLQRVINLDFFPNTQQDNYWSASDSAAQFAWAVSFADSLHNGGNYLLLDELTAHYVRLVRTYP